MFKITYTEASLMKNIVDSFKKLYDNFCVRVTKEFVELKAIDASRISILDGTLDKKHFEEYMCEGEVVFMVRLESFHKILNLAKMNDRLILEGQKEMDKMIVSFESKNDSRNGRFILNLKDDSQIINTPLTEFNFTHNFDFPAKRIQKIVNDFEILCEDIRLEINNKKVIWQIGSFGEEIKDAKTELLEDNSKDPFVKATIESSNSPLTMLFSSTYLKAICQPSTHFNRLKFSLGNNCPLLVEYDIIDAGLIKIYVSPKII